MAETRERCGCCRFVWSHFTFVTRIWGIATAVGLWGIGVEVIHGGLHLEIGLYLIITAILVTFLEFLFILDKCATKCCKEESCIFKCWSLITWIDNWKRSILYALLSIVCFLNPTTVWQAVISGIMLVVSALLYGIHTCKARGSNDQGTPSHDYDRFDEVHDETTATTHDEATAKDARQVFNDADYHDDDTEERDFRYNPFKDEEKERKRTPSFDLGTGSEGLNVSTLEV
ncbi:transmembrane protein 72-like [Ptychodera flava]|uniref:transmembrane protein 72-like n=1 Tax=Ptychodera flava TaxID=63121 RepID=UPI00396A67EE